MHLCKKGFVCLAILSSTWLWGESDTLNLTLSEALEVAEAKNYDLVQSDYRVQQARYSTFNYIATGLPQVVLTSQYARSFELPTTLLPAEITGGAPGTYVPVQFGVPYTSNFGLRVSQLLFDGSYIVGLKASKILVNISQHEYKKLITDVRQLVIQSYSLAVVSDENISVIEDLISAQKQLQKEVKAYWQSGFREETDYDQISLSVKKLESTLYQSEAAKKSAYRMLKFVLGIDIETPLLLLDHLSTLIESVDTLSYPTNITNHIDYQLAHLQLESKQYNLNSKKMNLLPSVSLFYQYGKNGQAQSANVFNEPWYPNSIGGIDLNWKIFSSFSKISEIRKAKIEVREKEVMQRSVEQALFKNMLDGYTELMTSTKRYRNAKDNERLANKIYERTKIKYREGMVNSTELINNEVQYINAYSSFLQAIIEMLNADVAYKKTQNRL